MAIKSLSRTANREVVNKASSESHIVLLQGLYDILEGSTNLNEIQKNTGTIKQKIKELSQSSRLKNIGPSLPAIDTLRNLLDIFLLNLFESLGGGKDFVSNMHSPQGTQKYEDLKIIRVSMKRMQDYISNFPLQDTSYDYPYNISLFSDFEEILRDMRNDSSYSLIDLPEELGIEFLRPKLETPSIVPESVALILKSADSQKKHGLDGFNSTQQEFIKKYLSLHHIFYERLELNKEIDSVSGFLNDLGNFLENVEIADDKFLSNMNVIFDNFYTFLFENIPQSLSLGKRNTYFKNEIKKFHDVLFNEILGNQKDHDTLCIDHDGYKKIQDKFPEITGGKGA